MQVHYNLFLGADLKLFSTAKAENHLRNMHEPNHRELAISKFAARVADFLWPGCQENVDEAIAKHKVMASKTRVHIPEPEYEPPKVPHVLPFTNWCASAQSLRMRSTSSCAHAWDMRAASLHAEACCAAFASSAWPAALRNEWQVRLLNSKVIVASCCRIRNSPEFRESFVCDAKTIYKPRMAWYNPNDGMVPSGWFTEGLLADLAYYKPFTGTRSKDQAWGA
jgi:hypothetical protein